MIAVNDTSSSAKAVGIDFAFELCHSETQQLNALYPYGSLDEQLATLMLIVDRVFPFAEMCDPQILRRPTSNLRLHTAVTAPLL